MGTKEVVPGQAAPTAGKAQGHPIGFWFFFWGEFAERSSFYGMRAILALYMTQRLGVTEANAGTFIAIFMGGCYLLPLLGGFLADNFFGKYWTIVGFSIPYVFGQLIVGIENKYVVTGALMLLAMGSGAIKPNISTLMGLTYDQQRPGQEQLRSNAFSWFYLAINVGAFLSQLAVPWLRTHYSYQVAFLFPAGLMALALVVFAAGKRFYAREVIERKVVGDDPGAEVAEGRTVTGLPIRATVVTPEQKAADRVMKLQTLGRIGSLFILVMFFWAIFDQSASTWIFFANTYMDCHLFGYPVTPDQVQSFNAFFIMTLLPLSVVFFNYMANHGRPIRATDKMAAGFILTALAMVIMSFAGFRAGDKQDAVKLTTPEGSVVLPMAAAPLESVRPAADGAADVRLGDDAQLMAADWTFNADNKKATLTNGRLQLPGGNTLVLAAGHVDAAQSSPAFAGGKPIEAAGVLEGQLKPRDETSAEPAKATLQRIDWVKPAERVTVWWQVLAYLILTIAEILISVTGLELAFVAAPPTMKSFVTACWLVTVGLANLFINAPITRLYPHIDPGAYFAILAWALVCVVGAFLPIASRFNRAMEQARREREESVEGNSEAV